MNLETEFHGGHKKKNNNPQSLLSCIESEGWGF